MKHAIVHYLILNSESIKSNYLNGRLSFIYFFFKYAEKYHKAHYSDFAFEQLKKIIASEFKKIRGDSENFDFKALEVSSALIEFNKLGFFESDDLNVLLQRFDTVAFFWAEHTKNTPKQRKSIKNTLLLTEYLGERNTTLGVDKAHNQKVNNCLSDLSQEFLHDLSFQRHWAIPFLTRSKDFFESIALIEDVQHISFKGLEYLQSLEVLRPDMIRKEYVRFSKNKNSNKQLQYAVWFPQELGDIIDYANLESSVLQKAEKLMKDLYTTKSKDAEYTMLRLTLLGSFLLERKTGISSKFLRKTIGSL